MADIQEQKTKSEQNKFCSDCGSIILIKAEICPNCGVRQTPVQTAGTANGKTKVAAILLALFLGGFGAHKFYLGQSGMGILYLLFFWTLIPAFIAMVELVMLIVMSDTEFNRRFGHL